MPGHPHNGGKRNSSPSARWLARLREVSEAALAVNSELDLHRVLQRVVDTARELVRARYAALGVARPDLSGLSEFIVSGMASEQIRAIGHWPRGLGLLGALLRDPRPLRVPKISDHPQCIGFPPHHPPMFSFLGVPVRLGDRILGNFYLTDKQGADEFSQEDEDVIVLFAAHVATAIENARRFTETRVRLDQSLLEIQRAERRAHFLAEMSTLLPVGPLVEEIPWEPVADGATELLGDGCAIYLVDPDDPGAVQARVVRHRDPARAEAERERLLAEVRRRAGELDVILTSIADGLIVFDAEGRIVRMNSSAERIMGYSDTERDMSMAERTRKALKTETAEGEPYPAEDHLGARALRGETVRQEVSRSTGQTQRQSGSRSARPRSGIRKSRSRGQS